MKKYMWKKLCQITKTTPVLLAASLAFANSASAQTSDTLQQLNTYAETGESMSQVSNVSQLRDVSPTDWAYEALRSLVERYGCIAGYPDTTFRGNRAMTRYEFAAGLNACLSSMERIIAASQSVLQEDIDKLKKLTSEFQAELAALGARVDKLEGRVAFLEDHQFSTTTKLNATVVVNLSQAFGDKRASGFGVPGPGSSDIESEVIMSDRVRLNFDTSFTGKDRLRTRLQAGNTPGYNVDTGSNTARLNYDLNNGNDLVVQKVTYRFPVGDSVRLHIGANGFEIDDVFDPKNPYFESSDEGSLSRFARFNPVIFRAAEGAGFGANVKFSKEFGMDLLYIAKNASDPNGENGLFNGSYAAGVQLNWSPASTLGLAATYIRSYDPNKDVNIGGSTGSPESGNPLRKDTSADRLGLQFTWKAAKQLNIAGWAGYANFRSEDGAPNTSAGNESFTAALNVAILDLAKEGSVLGIAFGLPPMVGGFTDKSDTTYFVEAQYKYPLNKNISITPGAYVIFNPNQDSDNDTIVIGTVRTVFKF